LKRQPGADRVLEVCRGNDGVRHFRMMPPGVARSTAGLRGQQHYRGSAAGPDRFRPTTREGWMQPETRLAARLHAPGAGPSDLHLEELPVPAPEPGDVLVQVHMAAI